MTLTPRSIALRRVGLGVLIAAELIRLAISIGLLMTPELLPGPGAEDASPLYSLATNPTLTWLLAGLGAAGALSFAARRVPLLGAITALACGAVLFHTHQYVRGQHDESFVQPAAALLGWLVGWGLARLMAGASSRDRADAFGVTGALAFFGATYVNAGLCKVLASGPIWLDAVQLQTVLAMFLGTGEPTWVHDIRLAVLASPRLCSALLIGTLIIEFAGALLPFGRRARMVAALGLLGMHAGMFLLATIIFWPAVLMLLLFGLPWERFVPEDDASALAAADGSKPPARGVLLAVGLTAIISATPWLLPVSELTDARQHPTFERIFEATREHNARVIGSAGQPERESTEPLSALGPLRTGLELPGRWRLERLEALGDGALLGLAHDAHPTVIRDLTVVGPDSPPRPFDAGGLELQYRRTDVPFERFEGALGEIARLLRTGAGPDGAEEVLRGWLAAAPRAR